MMYKHLINTKGINTKMQRKKLKHLDGSEKRSRVAFAAVIDPWWKYQSLSRW
jgi:hypothetical protein